MGCLWALRRLLLPITALGPPGILDLQPSHSGRLHVASVPMSSLPCLPSLIRTLVVGFRAVHKVWDDLTSDLLPLYYLQYSFQIRSHSYIPGGSTRTSLWGSCLLPTAHLTESGPLTHAHPDMAWLL